MGPRYQAAVFRGSLTSRGGSGGDLTWAGSAPAPALSTAAPTGIRMTLFLSQSAFTVMTHSRIHQGGIKLPAWSILLPPGSSGSCWGKEGAGLPLGLRPCRPGAWRCKLSLPAWSWWASGPRPGHSGGERRGRVCKCEEAFANCPPKAAGAWKSLSPFPFTQHPASSSPSRTPTPNPFPSFHNSWDALNQGFLGPQGKSRSSPPGPRPSLPVQPLFRGGVWIPAGPLSPQPPSSRGSGC